VTLSALTLLLNCQHLDAQSPHPDQRAAEKHELVNAWELPLAKPMRR